MAGGLFGKFQAQRDDEDPALAQAPQRAGMRPPMGGGAPATSHHGLTPGMPPGAMQGRAPMPTGPATPEQMAMVNPSQPSDDISPAEIAALMQAMNARASELQHASMPEQSSDIDLALRGGAPFSP